MHTPSFHEFLAKYPELTGRLNLIKAIKTGQESLWGDPSRGLALEALNDENLESMQRQSLNQGTPLSFQLDDSSYNFELIRRSLISLVYVVYEHELDPTMDPVSLVEKMDGVIADIIVNSLRMRESYFITLGEAWGISPTALMIIGEALIQPSIIYLASKCMMSYLDNWGETICPVCGRYPSIAVKYESEVWRFKCSLCWAEYKMDIFSCPHCKSDSFDEKEFLLVGDSQEFEVAICSKCNHYYKIINKAKLKEAIPEGLNDLYTVLLDEIAHERGLVRLDERTSGNE